MPAVSWTACRWMLRSVVILAIVLPGGNLPAAERASELEVKAAFLPKFAPFVRWPEISAPRPGEVVMLCVLGSDPFGAILDRAAAAQSGGGNPITVKRVETVEQARRCHIVYASDPLETSATVWHALKGLPILTVTDGSLPQWNRGVIHFALSGSRLGFHVDDEDAARRGLDLSSKLLSLALSRTSDREPKG